MLKMAGTSSKQSAAALLLGLLPPTLQGVYYIPVKKDPIMPRIDPKSDAKPSMIDTKSLTLVDACADLLSRLYAEQKPDANTEEIGRLLSNLRAFQAIVAEPATPSLPPIDSSRANEIPLFYCDDRPVYEGDRLHVSPGYQWKAGAIVIAEFKANGDEVTMRSLNGAVPTVPIAELSWRAHPDVTDRERISNMTGAMVREISNRDLRMFRLGRDYTRANSVAPDAPTKGEAETLLSKLILNAPAMPR